MPEYRIREASSNDFDVSVEQGTFGDYEVYGVYGDGSGDGPSDEFEIFIVSTNPDVRTGSVIRVVDGGGPIDPDRRERSIPGSLPSSLSIANQRTVHHHVIGRRPPAPSDGYVSFLSDCHIVLSESLSIAFILVASEPLASENTQWFECMIFGSHLKIKISPMIAIMNSHYAIDNIHL